MPILVDGFSTTITFGLSPGVSFHEKEVTPPEMDGGGPIDTTTMRNVYVHTSAPKKLKKFGNMTAKVTWNPDDYSAIYNDLLQKNGEISVYFPGYTTPAVFWGWLDKFKQDAYKEGEQPMAEITIEISNYDYANSLEIPPTAPAI